MAKIKINRLTNANVYIDGENLLGRAEEVTPGAIKQLMQEHGGLGTIGKLKLPSGGIEVDDATFKWSSFYPEVIKKGASGRNALQLQVRGSLEEHTGEGIIGESPCLLMLGGIFNEMAFGTFKRHEAVIPEMKFTTYYMKLVIDGEELVEVDLFNNIHKVAGEDLLSRFRTLIGG